MTRTQSQPGRSWCKCSELSLRAPGQSSGFPKKILKHRAGVEQSPLSGFKSMALFSKNIFNCKSKKSAFPWTRWLKVTLLHIIYSSFPEVHASQFLPRPSTGWSSLFTSFACYFPPHHTIAFIGAQGRVPPSTLQWHVDYFELKSLEKQQGGASSPLSNPRK